MKNAIKTLALTVACCAAAVSFVGCSGNSVNPNNNGNNSASGSSDGLQFDTKYYYHYNMHNIKNGNAVYFVFYSDGTCTRFSHRNAYSSSSYFTRDTDVEMYYKYTYLDEQRTGIICFIDGIKETSYDDDGNVYDINTTLSPSYEKDYYIFSVSKNVLMYAGESSYTFYINENYVDEIPNFYPKKDN